MKKITKTCAAAAFIILSLFSFSSCSSGNKEAQERFGYDAEYFMGLKLLYQGDSKAAKNKLKKCVDKGTYYCARKSAETLCLPAFGNVQEQIEAAEKVYNEYKDSDSLLFLVKLLNENNEIHKIIEYTNDCDFKEEYNEIIKIRLESLKKRNDTRYENEVYKWFTVKPISSFHYKFYRDFYEHPKFDYDYGKNVENAGSVPSPQQFVINYRIETYNRNYLYTFDNINNIIEFFEANLIPYSEQLASDIGKAYLYGSSEYSINGKLCRQLAGKFAGSEMEFYFLFYSGRLFDKSGLNIVHSKNCFEAAINVAKTDGQRDNALWYLLDTSLSTSLDSIINSIGKYAAVWHDPEYFDDFFESLLTSLISGGRWDTIGAIYKIIDGYATNETVAQFAYVYGRLSELGFASGNETDIKEAYTRACNAGYSIYYKSLAAYRLGLSEEQLEQVLTMPYGKADKPADLAAERLLSGYAYFGFPELIYKEWENLYEKGLSPETSLYISNFLNKCSTGKDDYYHQSLRIASRILSEHKSPLKKEYWNLIYPKNYSSLIEEYCEEYGAIPSTIYALVRSESYFNPNVSSHAGAIGLSQLMESTGSDIARKLKRKEYSLTDPATNLEFCIFYLAELTRRCDDSPLSAFFSYNAGITRVRRWKQNTIVGFGTKENMPIDLFLETLPYAETREYGRKILSASVMYEWLYSDNPLQAFTEIIETLLR